MKLGFRELLFLTVMLGLFGCTYFMVFRKANAKREIGAGKKVISDRRFGRKQN